MSGHVPSELSGLTSLTELDLGGNGSLLGPLPGSLTALTSLEDLRLDGTGVCAPTDAAFQEWLGGITNRGGVVDCVSETPDRAALVALYNATDGPNWGDKTNWLSNRPLGDWHGVDTDNNGRVMNLGLSNNQLSGQIPSELSDLTNLTELFLSGNELSGQIPSELSGLTNLTWLHLGNNQLSGQIPSELSDLIDLEFLSVGGNRSLSGRLPGSFTALTSLEYLRVEGTGLCAPGDTAFKAWLGGIANKRGVVDCVSDSTDWAPLVALYNATDGPNWGDKTNWLTNIPLEHWYGVDTDNNGRVTHLSLLGNELSGQIPSELSDLTNLTHLYLGDNELSGQIPSGLSGLTNLTHLHLSGNELSGKIPSDLSYLTDLIELDLGGNPSLSGPLPGSFTALTSLEDLRLDGTGLCVPTDTAFQEWLQDIEEKEGVVNCTEPAA